MLRGKADPAGDGRTRIDRGLQPAGPEDRGTVQSRRIEPDEAGRLGERERLVRTGAERAGQRDQATGGLRVPAGGAQRPLGLEGEEEIFVGLAPHRWGSRVPAAPARVKPVDGAPQSRLYFPRLGPIASRSKPRSKWPA